MHPNISLQLSIAIHPDKCHHKLAADAFHKMESAYKQLLDVEQRRIYVRVMREAKDRVDYERSKENKRRKDNGKWRKGHGSLLTFLGIDTLPDDTYGGEISTMTKSLFTEIEEKKQIFQRIEVNARKRARETVEKDKIKMNIAKEEKVKWENGREDRFNNWRKFTSK